MCFSPSLQHLLQETKGTGLAAMLQATNLYVVY